MIPSTIHPSVKSNAEKRLFSLFKNAPGTEDWVCLHSLGLARHETKRKAEIDFLLLSPYGIFILEVKGGGVSRKDGKWHFKDKYGNIHVKHEGPFEQAGSAMFILEKEVRDHFKDAPKLNKLLFGYGVMLPDTVFDQVGVDYDRRQVYDAIAHREPILDFIKRLSAFWGERTNRACFKPNKYDIEQLVQFLRGDFDLVTPLSVLAESILEQQIALEKEQYAVLDTLENYDCPRILIQGGAGTGKTLLAMEVARRQARKGEGKVLLLCYNRLLATYLDTRINCEQYENGQVVVKTLYALLKELIDESSLSDEFAEKCKGADSNKIYKELFPEYAMLAIAENGVTPYKTVIIDEAQDIMTQDLLDLVDAYIEGGFEAGSWWVFCDVNNQAAVYGSFEKEALQRLERQGQTSILAVNRRNTKPIAIETALLTNPKIRSISNIEGVAVTYSWYDNPKGQKTLLMKLLKQFMNEGIEPCKITILSSKRLENSCAASVTDLKIEQLSANNIGVISTPIFKNLSCSTISAFKGLENDIIIITDIDDISSEWARSVIYVGMTRAKISLNLLLDSSLRKTYEQQCSLWLSDSMKVH